MTDKKRTITTCLGIIFVLFLIFGMFYQQKHKKETEPISRTAFKLNTVVTVTIYDSTDETLLQEVLALCEKYENMFSRTKESSEISQLNNGTLPQENGTFTLSNEAAELISKGLEYGRLSDGAFDITIEPISSMWDFTSEEKSVPAQEELEAALPLINYEDVTLDRNKLQFKQPGMGLDLGAIAKGYIAGQMKEFLLSKGVRSAIINLGGNVLCVGSKPDGKPFSIGIQKPFAGRSETIASVNISDKSVVSSGIYERFFEKDDVFYHHILNPKTGYPYDNSLVSVTIISEQSVDGDGLSTSCFALGLEKGMELVNSLPDVHAVFITSDYELHYSEGFEEEISMQ